MGLLERDTPPKPSDDRLLHKDLPTAFVQQQSANLEQTDSCGAPEDSQRKQTPTARLSGVRAFRPLCGAARRSPAPSPVSPPALTVAARGRQGRRSIAFRVCAQLLHMTVDISFCCQNVINKTWGVERATVPPFNHYSICNENFMQCVIFS